MIESVQVEDSPADILCKSCGLCCTGHLFSWVRLKSSELDSSEAMGLNVIRSDPRQRGFTQPCPLWLGQCTVHASPHYPRVCRNYQCKLLKGVLENKIPLRDALAVVIRAMEMIEDVDSLMPDKAIRNFRERLIVHLDRLKEFPKQEDAALEFEQKAKDLLVFYSDQFGVSDLIDKTDAE